MTGGLDDLCAITDALYQTDLARLQAITAEENALRGEMAALDDEVRRAETLPEDGAMALRQFGGDLLWKAWVGRKRQALNLKLANLRVRKQTALQALQRSFGKKSVSMDLQVHARQDQRSQHALRQLAEEQSQMVLQASRARSADR